VLNPRGRRGSKPSGRSSGSPLDVTVSNVGYGFEGAIEETNLALAATAIRVAA